MQSAGYAALQVIPSFKNLDSNLERGTSGAFTKIGASGGAKFGDAAGKSAASGMRSHLKTAAGFIIGGLVGAEAIRKTGDLIRDSLDEARDSQKVSAVTEARIRSTGKAAGLTARQIGNLSTALSNKVGIDDETIQRGANMLLTFKNIRNETGKNNDVFTQATSITTDLAASMAGAKGGEPDLKSASILVGKALNDPLKGLTALTRVGVSFDDQQKKQIGSLVKQGDTMKAQKIIIKELNSEFGGTAASQATMADKLRVAWKNVEEDLGTKLLPLMDDLEHFLLKKGIPAAEDFVQWFGKKGAPEIKQFVDGAKPLANSLLPAIGSGLKDVAGFLKDAAPYAKRTIDAFNSLPDWAKKSIVLGVGTTYLAKKTGALSLGKSVLGGSGGVLKIATKAEPLPVFVVNEGFGPGTPGTPTPVPGGSPKIPGLVGGAVAGQIAKGILDDIGVFRRQNATPTPTDPSALAASQLGAVQGFKTKSGSKIDIDFERLSQSLDRFGSHSLYAQQLTTLLKSHDLVVNPNQAGSVQNALRDLSEAEKIADRLIKGNVLSKVPDALERSVSALTQPLARASAGLDLVSRQGNHTFGGLNSDTDAFGHKIDNATTRTDILEGRLRRFPKRIRTELDLDTTAAERNLATLRAHAGRHMPATLSIELAGRPSPQRALDGVRR